MSAYIDYVEKLIKQIQIAEIPLYRDIAYSRTRAVLDAFCSFNHIVLGDTKRLEEQARTAYKEWSQG